MARYLEFMLEDALHHAIAVDDEGDAPVEAQERPKHAVAVADVAVGVADHREGRLDRIGEGALRAVVVHRNADHPRTEGPEIGIRVPESRRLPLAARREGLRKKI